jgi:flagellar basal body-associated protein FliL
MAQPAQAPAEEAVGPAPAPAAAKKKSPLGMLIVVAGVVGLLGYGGYSYMSMKAKAKELIVKEWLKTAPLSPVTFALDPVTVNLADGDKYARLAPTLVFDLDVVDGAYFKEKAPVLHPPEGGAKGGEGEGEGKKKKADATVPKKEPGEDVKKLVEALPNCLPRLQDATIEVLGARKFEQLLSVADKEKVKEALTAKFTDILAETKIPVKQVLFAEFIMQ